MMELMVMETKSVTDYGEKSDDVVVLSPTSVLVNGDLTSFDNFRFCEVDDFDFDVDLFFQLPEFGMWRNTTAKSPASITLMILPLKLGSRHRAYPNHDKFINKKIEMFEEMSLVYENDRARGDRAKSVEDIDLDCCSEKDNDNDIEGPSTEKDVQVTETSQAKPNRKRKRCKMS
ncbi:hypothetical protein CQW23_28996 [Capsicum baccatum]|uniref:Uncharacterized protein n=1 Tax=Capsicum baccatum TaxID=33114 RepID=A0A2G2VI83_CAPBA|nr:hypothetical protein CQW23_28996 [Capsicum baccatum]